MGAKSSTVSQSNEYAALLKEYEIVKQVESEGLFYLKSIRTGGDFLLRELTFNDKKQFDRWLQMFNKRKGQLQNCKYVVSLDRIITKEEDQYCSTFYKIYALFQYTERTLQDEINERSLLKRRFQEKELWSILASCIVGMSHLQRQAIKHQSLRSNTILISADGVVKVYDPITTGCQTNYDTLIAKRSTPHIYISPQLAESLQMEAGQPHSNSFKSDIWAMGVIVLEAGLLKYQDDCYRDQTSRVHWETLKYNIHIFRQNYSQELAALVEFMLSREEKHRPDWLELEQRVIKEEETRMSQANISKQSNVSHFSQRPYNAINYNPAVRNTVRQHPSHLLGLQTVPVHSDTPRFNSKPIVTTTIPSPPMRSPLVESNTMMSGSVGRVRPSIIDSSRPLRNIFPACTYVTLTKVDENLIVIAEDQRLSEVEATPKNKQSTASFFQTQPVGNGVVQSIKQQTLFNTFTPTHAHPMKQQVIAQPQSNTYGVSFYHPPTQNLNPQSQAVQQISFTTNQQQPHKTSASYQTPIQQTPPISSQQIIHHPPYTETTIQPNFEQTNAQAGEYVIEKYRQGSEYKGYKWQDMRHGFGIFYYQDGGMYQGEWKFNKMQGKGKLFYQSGKLAYEGDWANDQFQGYGTLYNEYPQVINQPLNYKNLEEIQQMWTKYQGEFQGDLKSGYGTLFLSNGQYYQGDFSDDYAHGEGIYIRMDGEKVTGSWNHNIFVE